MELNGIFQNKPDALIVKRTSYNKRRSEVPKSAIDSAKEILDSIPDLLSSPNLKVQVEAAIGNGEPSTPKAVRESSLSNPGSPTEPKKAKKYDYPPRHFSRKHHFADKRYSVDIANRLKMRIEQRRASQPWKQQDSPISAGALSSMLSIHEAQFEDPNFAAFSFPQDFHHFLPDWNNGYPIPAQINHENDPVTGITGDFQMDVFETITAEKNKSESYEIPFEALWTEEQANDLCNSPEAFI